MRRRLVFFSMLAAVCMLPAQETHRTVASPSPHAADDAKPDSSAVPDEYALTGKFDSVVVVRVKHGADLLEAMKRAVKEQNIQNGVILSAIGSLRGYALHQVSNREFPVQDTFEKNPMQPADLVSMNGYIINGRIHAHMTLATPDHVVAGTWRRATTCLLTPL